MLALLLFGITKIVEVQNKGKISGALEKKQPEYHFSNLRILGS
jgi:hypothetical protein